MADINVTINPAPQVGVSVGEGIVRHASTHAPGASDSLEAYYATTGSLAYVSGLMSGAGDTGYLTGYVLKSETGAFVKNTETGAFLTTGAADARYVWLTGNQQISGFKTFVNSGLFQSDLSLSGKLIFDTAKTGQVLDGEVSWNTAYNTLQVGMNGGDVVNPFGFKNFYRVKANQNIAKGKVIMSVGTVGNSEFILAQEAANIGLSGELIMGVSAEDIAAGSFGDVVSFGPVRGVDTSLFASGVILYFNTSSTGGFTNIAPQAPNAKVIVAQNLHPATNGTVFVRVSAGSVLGGTDSNVKFSTLQDKDLIFYSAASGFWYNKGLTTGDVSGISNYALKSETGSFITTSQTGNFYPASNPSGFITGVDLSAYVTGDVVRPSETGNFVTNSQTGAFYPASNPSGFITGVDLSAYVTGSVVRPSETGAFLTTGAADFRYVGLTGDQTISGVKDFVSRPTVNGTGVLLSGEAVSLNTGELTGVFYPLNSNPSGYITGVDLSFYATQSYVTGVSGHLQGQINTLNGQTGNYVTGSVVRPSETGIFVTTSQTGQFVTGSVVRPTETGSFITSSQTGAFYPSSNPSGFITGVDLSAYVTGSVVRPSETGEFLTTGVANAIYALQSQTGDFITSGQTGYYTGIFYPYASNPAGYITGSVVRFSDTGNFADLTSNQTISGTKNFSTRPTVNGTGVLLSGEAVSSNTGELTGVFYPLNSNPSGYITGVDLSAYATQSYVTGTSGYLQGQINTLNSATGSYVTGDVVRPSETGSFVTTSQTGQFVGTGSTGVFLTTGQAANLYYPISSGQAVSGFAVTGYNLSITGISVTGDTTKTISLFRQNGTILSASFSDNSGTGGGGGTGTSVEPNDSNLIIGLSVYL